MAFSSQLHNSTYYLSTYPKLFYSCITAIVLLGICLFVLLNLTKIIKIVLESNFLKRVNLPLSSQSWIIDFLKQAPNLSFSTSARILILSLIIRIAKYLALTNLFLRLSDGAFPTTNNILAIFISFVGAELVASLPGSGVFGFGGYELAFQSIITSIGPDLRCNLNIITSIHLLGLLTEISFCLLILPIFLLLSKLIKKRRGAKNSPSI